MIHQLLTGAIFNQQYLNKKFVKLTNQLENHNGYQFQTGLNIDSIPFNPQGKCNPGGIYFCLFEDLQLWLNYIDQEMFYIRLVTIPDDALVWTEQNKFKADRLILSDRLEIGDLEVWKDPAYCLTAVKYDGLSLRFIKQQTPEICLEAVKNNDYGLLYGYALKYVLEQTEEICVAAVKKDGLALKYVTKQTPQICLEAVKNNGYALASVLEQTEEICLAAVQKYGCALLCVTKQTHQICLAAVQNDADALKYVLALTPEICLATVQKDGKQRFKMEK